MSAKMLRFKQLQNQLADAHYHLNVNIEKHILKHIYFFYFLYVLIIKNNLF